MTPEQRGNLPSNELSVWNMTYAAAFMGCSYTLPSDRATYAAEAADTAVICYRHQVKHGYNL